MQYTTLRDVIKPKPIPRKKPKSPKPPKPPKQATAPVKPKASRRCPSGFRWDSKKGKCVQAGVGPEYKP